MPWSKGAVVIVKHGDHEMADAIEQGIAIYKASKAEVEEMERDLTFLRKRDRQYWNEMIDEANELYGRNRIPPKWAKKLVEGFAFLVYHFSMFVENVCEKFERGDVR